MLNLWEVFGAEIPRANACGVAIEVNKLRVAEARHTDPDELYSNSIVLLSMVLLEPGHKVCVHSSNNRNSLAPAKQERLFLFLFLKTSHPFGKSTSRC